MDRTAKEAEILKKIGYAREITEKMQKNPAGSGLSDILLKLTNITDKIELTYNDVLVKRYRCRAAIDMMNKLEKHLDKILFVVNKNLNNKS